MGSLIPLCTVKEAVGLARCCVLAMAAGVWVEIVSLALEAVAEVQVGMVLVNSHKNGDAACGWQVEWE